MREYLVSDNTSAKPRHLSTRVREYLVSDRMSVESLDIYLHAYVSTWSVIGPLKFSDIYTILHSVALFVKNCRNMFFSFKSVVHFLKFEIQFLIRKYNTLTVLHQNKENPFSPLFETQINSFFLRFWPFHVFLSFIFFNEEPNVCREFDSLFLHTDILSNSIQTLTTIQRAISTNISWCIVEQSRKTLKMLRGTKIEPKKACSSGEGS